MAKTDSWVKVPVLRGFPHRTVGDAGSDRVRREPHCTWAFRKERQASAGGALFWKTCPMHGNIWVGP